MPSSGESMGHNWKSKDKSGVPSHSQNNGQDHIISSDSGRPSNINSSITSSMQSTLPGHLPKFRSQRQVKYRSDEKIGSPSTPDISQEFRLKGFGSRHAQLDILLGDSWENLQTCGVEDIRDGFFDPSFPSRSKQKIHNNPRPSQDSLPPELSGHHPLSFKYFLPEQWKSLLSVFKSVLRTRSGIKLIKSFLPVYIAFSICLVDGSRLWLGRYNYMIVISALISHSGRTVGAQIDALVLTCVGTLTGLGWGAFALWASTSTAIAQRGYGGIIATFLIVFTAIIAWLRCVFIRSYQMVISAGIAICFICLADVSETIQWKKLLDYGKPWALGQVLSIVICIIFFPDAGSRSLAIALHNAIVSIQMALGFERQNRSEFGRDLAWSFVKLSEAHRDFRIETTYSHFTPSDVRELRNQLQALLRAVMVLKPNSQRLASQENIAFEKSKDAIIDIESSKSRFEVLHQIGSSKETADLISKSFGQPTRALLASMSHSLHSIDDILMSLSGYHYLFNRPAGFSESTSEILERLQESIERFDETDLIAVENSGHPNFGSQNSEVAEIFLLLHPIRHTAQVILSCLRKVTQMQASRRNRKLRLPSYPFRASLMAVNEQVRHDRGGLTIGFYFNNKIQLKSILDRTQKTIYQPTLVNELGAVSGISTSIERGFSGKYEQEKKDALESNNGLLNVAGLRYRAWLFLHWLQGFETRFALKVVIVTTTLSIPAWLGQSRSWWNTQESWLAVVMAWLMMHPRVGGNFHDLATRIICGVLGAIWGALSVIAGNKNPYVVAVFAALFLLPMIHRFTQSSHPRSGLVGCVSFVVVSLSSYANKASQSPVHIAWTRSAAITTGVTSAVTVNWILWPFVARHEVRKSVSALMLHLGILYRGVISKYVYYEEHEKPDIKDVSRSEVIEALMREGFVRMRQLIALTRHEIRLSAPFDPVPYSCLLDCCEKFFELLIEVRQSSLYFQPYLLSGNLIATNALIGHRRDAVAAILTNLYVLAGALRSDRPVPYYMPSAAIARKKLLDRMAEIEMEISQQDKPVPFSSSQTRERKWAHVYQYAYSAALTDLVEQLEHIRRFTISIVGESRFGDE